MASKLAPEAFPEDDTELELDFDKLMNYSLMCLRSNNSHPDTPRDFRWVVRFVFKHLIYSCLMFLLTLTLFSIEDIQNNLIEACGMASLMVVYGVINFKYFVLLNYRSAFSLIIADVKKYYVTAKTLPKEERKVVEKYALAGKKVTIYWVIMSGSTTICFIFVPLSMMVFYYLRGTPKYVSAVEVVFPEIFTSYFNEDVLFWIVFSLWIFYDYYSVCMYLGLVPLGPIFILTACAQLELLKMRAMKLFPEDGSVTPEQRTAMLRRIAIELQGIYDFVDNLKAALQLLYEMTLKGTALITPVLAYVMLEAIRQKQVRPEFATLFFGAILICSMPCYYGDKLIEKSSELQEAVYMSGWETKYEKKTRSTLLIFLTRLQKTVAIRTIFVTVCLEALADVINQAYALFSLLHAAWG